MDIPEEFENRIFCKDALTFLKKLPRDCIHLAVTSPPYWNVVDYEIEEQIGQSSYDEYIEDLLKVWLEAERVLVPNGKLAIVTPIMPIAKRVISDQHSRHLKNINNDIESSLFHSKSKLLRYSLFIWQKQTSEKMFGSYPYPPNIYENNTIEFINVLVKPGKPRSVPKRVKEKSKLSQKEWPNLTMQVWPMYPEDVKRNKGHLAPFPTVLPERLIKMYTFKRVPEHDFEGDVVLDMFNGSGTTCVAAKRLGRRFVGIDINPEFCKIARSRVNLAVEHEPHIILQRIKVTKPEPNANQLEFLQPNHE